MSGLKRFIAAVLSLVLGVLIQFPGHESWTTAIQVIAGLLGVTSLVHAAALGSLSRATLAGITAALTAIIAGLQFIPALQPYIPMLQQIAAFIGASAIGASFSTKSTTPDDPKILIPEGLNTQTQQGYLK